MLKGVKKWFSKKKETSVLNTDSFDKRRFEQIFDMSKRLKQMEGLSQYPMFKELLGDIWASLYKMSPELKDEIPEQLEPNKELISRLLDNKDYQNYHSTTQLDDFMSAVGAVRFGEVIHDWIEKERQENEALNDKLEQIQDLVQQMLKEQERSNEDNHQNQGDQSDQNPEEGQGDQQQDSADQSKSEGSSQSGESNGNSSNEQAINNAMAELGRQLAQFADQNSSLSEAIQSAVEDTENTKDALNVLFGGKQAGSGKGELQKMPLRNKLALAEVISKDEKMKQIAKWTGRFTEIAKTKQKNKHKHVSEQSGVEAGDEIERLLPSELVQYANPSTKKEFLRKLSEEETLQFEKRGKESLGRGSIIVCLDQSASMSGNLEIQSKGFALALLSIAKRQKRNFAHIPFSTFVGKVTTFPKGKVTSNELLDIAKNFMGGGTSFKEPLNQATKIINKDKFKDADIVFITDGEAKINDQFAKRFNDLKSKKEFNVLSLVLKLEGRTDQLAKVSDRVIRIEDLNDEGAFEAFEI